MVNKEGHKDRDFSDFVTEDWLYYDMLGELLFDSEYVRYTEKTGVKLPILRKHHLSKKMCQELSPIDNSPYGEPYEFYQISGEIQKVSLHDMFRQEMRAVM